jgi:hypothetical protein
VEGGPGQSEVVDPDPTEDKCHVWHSTRSHAKKPLFPSIFFLITSPTSPQGEVNWRTEDYRMKFGIEI